MDREKMGSVKSAYKLIQVNESQNTRESSNANNLKSPLVVYIEDEST